jgi:hypothetical protein
VLPTFADNPGANGEVIADLGVLLPWVPSFCAKVVCIPRTDSIKEPDEFNEETGDTFPSGDVLSYLVSLSSRVLRVESFSVAPHPRIPRFPIECVVRYSDY